MEIKWLSNSMDGFVTIYETNITLNKVAANHFTNTYATLIGFNGDDSTLIIKSLSKEEAQNGFYKENNLHSISVKKTYGRINGKNIIKNISNYFPLNFSTKNSHKFKCEWDQLTHSLIIFLKEEIF